MSSNILRRDPKVFIKQMLNNKGIIENTERIVKISEFSVVS